MKSYLLNTNTNYIDLEEINGESVLVYREDTGEFWEIKGPMCYVLGLLENSVTKEEIVEMMMKEYKVESQTLLPELESFLEILVEQKIVLSE